MKNVTQKPWQIFDTADSENAIFTINSTNFTIFGVQMGIYLFMQMKKRQKK